MSGWWKVTGWLVAMAAGVVGCGDETSEPDPFSCEAVAVGESLGATAEASAGTLDVRVASNNGSFVETPAVDDVSGATLGLVVVVDGVVRVPFTGTTPSVAFTLDGRLTSKGTACPVTRRFSVSIDGDDATIQ